MGLVKLMTEPEYRQVNAVSYSMLSGVSKTPASLLNTTKFETASLTYGSAVDTLAFDGEEVFKSKFAVNSCASPSDIIEKIVKEIIVLVKESKGSLDGTLDEYDDLILSVAKAKEYGKGWHDPTVLRKVKDEGGRDLFAFVQENENKLILDTLQYQNVINSVHTLYTHEFCSKWLNAGDDEEVVFQFPILWTYKGIPCKSLFDIIKIDHKNKVIYPVDLKTSYDHVLGFPKNFLKWNYSLQASFYSDALVYYKLQNKDLFTYRIEPFRFIIISSQDPMKPLVYKTTEMDLWVGKHGGKIKGTGEYVRGYEQLIEDMQWHQGNNLYDYPRHVYEVSGELLLDVFE